MSSKISGVRFFANWIANWIISFVPYRLFPSRGHVGHALITHTFLLEKGVILLYTLKESVSVIILVVLVVYVAIKVALQIVYWRLGIEYLGVQKNAIICLRYHHRIDSQAQLPMSKTTFIESSYVSSRSLSSWTKSVLKPSVQSRYNVRDSLDFQDLITNNLKLWSTIIGLMLNAKTVKLWNYKKGETIKIAYKVQYKLSLTFVQACPH